ncbi:circularly permuted type 2 ATP-grasp protein [Rubellicoccus peritrichatus]|uniref:Circularly permuted type 2 ATP-grasp protein n=1 Tax=Rubellicoccus peritrichatus TaxID=3080537 RepID=A0AAQ3QVJ0_9BACT|nr:circularly permuted type 2 ATP-grasp protein [Puniceicoccus sp. CR14]WOO40950.1 circularly permuted type 2 ATP-grasp protein [Puniceicoccus sp. CR14]
MSRVNQSGSRDHFKFCSNERDETSGQRGKKRSDYDRCMSAINELTPSELQLRQTRIDRAAVELGLHFDLYDQAPKDKHMAQLDLFPRIISTQEWKKLSAGVIQRAQAFDSFIADIYNEQSILKDRVIPHDVVLTDPAFQRQFSGFVEKEKHHCTCGAIDLVRAEKGEWYALENHLATPFGLSFVVQNRRMLAQAFPEIFETMSVSPVVSFTTQLLETLRAQTSQKKPRIVLLTRGESNQAFFEESFLARHMGIALTRPGDLLVRESQVFLKTIRGLERVDVIYRRLESSSIDPVALPQNEFNGVPGLVNCVRKGTVSIVNALGTGVADNRAMLRYSDRITSYYLQQTPLLKTVPTFHLSDRDQAEHVRQYAKDMVFKPIQDHYTMSRYFGGNPLPTDKSKLQRLIKKQPELFVAQPYIHPTRLPHYGKNGFKSRSIFMRVFFLLGERPVVLPGGLTTQEITPQESNRVTTVAGGMKDTWIPLKKETAPKQNTPRKRREAHGDFSISSRVAEALYWIGRYLDRTESTSRQLNILEDIRWDQLPQKTKQSFWPLWRAVAAATGQETIAARKTPPKNTLLIARQLLLDSDEPASVFSCIRAALHNAESIRDFVNPEMWQALVELLLYLEEESKSHRLSRSRLNTITAKVVGEIARIWGTAERTLLHDDGWQFLRIGSFAERAFSNMTLTGDTLERTLKTFTDADEEDTDLAALLQLLGSLDAYRREYSSRAYIDRVAHILIQSPNNPSSITYCLKNISYALGTLTIQGENPLTLTLKEEVDALTAYIQKLPLDDFFPAPAEMLDAGKDAPKSAMSGRPKAASKAFSTITAELEKLHQKIEDAYFSHQNAFGDHGQMGLFQETSRK